MARPIDEKIVAMKMDNSDFKRKASETTSLFGKLTNALNKIPGVDLGKVSKSFDGIQRSADKVDMTGLSNSISGVAGQFSNLQVVATTALATIASKATSVGMGLAHDLGLGQVISGFKEYETKIGATNTMLFNTQWAGTTLEDVKKTLAELNTYADETIYSFGEMTRSIGRFTTAGVGLEDASIAIKGLGNLAALSGASGEQFNRALYQTSQALQGDYFMAIDWTSIEEAGMGGKYTKDSLIETAEAMGIVVDKSVPFRQSLKDGWLTTEVFIATMRKFGEDKAMVEAATKVRTLTQFLTTLKEGIGSGWAESWEIVFGDFEEATKRFTALSNFFGGIFDKMAHDRNKFLSAVFEGGTLGNMFDGLQNVIKPIGQIFGAIGDGFRAAFPPMSGKSVANLIENFKELTENLELSEDTVNNLKTIFEGFFSVFAVGWKVIQTGAIAIWEILSVFGDLGAMIIELISKVAQIPIEFNSSINASKMFKGALEGIKTVASGVASVLEYVVGGLIVFAGAVSEVYGILVKGDFTGVGPWYEDSKIVDKIFRIREALISFIDTVGDTWKVLLSGEFSGDGLFSKDSGTAQFLSKIGDGFRDVGSAIMDLEFTLEPIGNAFKTLWNGLKDFYGWITDIFSTIGSAIKNNIPSGNDILSGGIIAAMVTVVGFALKFAWELMNMFKGWGEMGQNLSDALQGIGDALNAFTWQVRVNMILTIAIALGILAVSFWSLSKLDSKQVANVLYALIGSLTALLGAMAIISKYDIVGTGMKASAQIIALSIAFGILSIALKNISDMKWGEITRGLFGLAGTMGVFAGAIAIMGKFGGAKLGVSAIQMIALAGTVFILVSALKEIAEQPYGVLIKGMAGLAVLLGIFATAVSTMSKFGGRVAASALQFVAIAGSVLLLVHAMKEISEIDTANLLIGLATIGAILAAVAAFSMVVKNASIMSAGVGITLLAIALNLMIVPILALGSMDLRTLAKGLGAMAIALVAIGLASKLMTGMVAAGAGLILLAVGLNMLLVPIGTFAAMPLKALAIGIGAVAVGILAIGGAAILLGNAAPALLLGALGITAIGIALLAAGAGIALFSTGLVTLSTMTAAAVTTIVATLGTLIVGLASLIPKAVQFMWDLIIAMANSLITNAPILVDKFMTLMTKILNKIAERIPEYALAATNMIVAFLNAIETNVPRIVDAIASLMVALANSIRENGPKIQSAFLTIMGELVLIMIRTGIAVINALFGWIPGVTTATAKIGKTAEATIRANFNAAGAGLDKGNDFSGSLRSTRGGAQQAGAAVGSSAESGAGTADLYSIGDGHGIDFANALGGTSYDARGSGQSIAISGKDGAGSISMGGTGTNFGLGFANGIDSQSVMSSVWSAGVAIARAAKNAVAGWLDMRSPSRLMKKDGGFFTEGFAIGIKDKVRMVAKNAKDLAITAKDSLNQFLQGFQLPEDDNELHFKAVVDYDSLDTRKFGNLAPLSFRPDTSLTSGLATAARYERYANNVEPYSKNEPNNQNENRAKKPSVIQVVTPDRREIARWMVDDITEFQDFKMHTTNQF